MTRLLNTHKASLFVKHLSISVATIIDFGGTEGKSPEHSRCLCWLLFPFAAFITEIKTLSFCPVFCPLRLFLTELPHLQDSFVDKLLELMPRLSSCKPVELVKILQTTLRQSGLLQLRLPEQVVAQIMKEICRKTDNVCVYPAAAMSRVVNRLLFCFSSGSQIHRATATIIEPTGESDNPLRFTSGLVVALDIDATLEHVQDPQNTVKVQVGLM